MWPQEPDELDGPRLSALGVGVVVMTVVLSGFSAGLQTQWRERLGGPRTFVALGSGEETPPSDLFSQAFPERTAPPESPQWVDQVGGTVALPLDDAITIVLGEAR